MVGDKWHSINGGDKYGSVFYLKTGGPCFTSIINTNPIRSLYSCLSEKKFNKLFKIACQLIYHWYKRYSIS
ncbi:hypothetical protein BpHYR1_043341 [Brachionus plicatilis]|uniref:Uncharacterized protein n=1 Tax=Brachionus plicatilis TaxID=10195 RepID=A0A3M7QI11_BRAPC|nr:hypothetical protein BpHYR1_043341 [Brachionus plicatilis]